MKKHYRNDYNPMKHVRKAIPKPGFDYKDKSKYDRTKKHKNQGDQS